jgi:spermidine synthase
VWLLFLLAYASSGLAGLIYQVCWTRLLTLYIGHSTAAASTVVAAFLGGLAAGAAIGGRLAIRLTPVQALIGYGVLEVSVAIIALLMPFEIRALTPLLAATYADGMSPVLFPAVRFVACVVMVFVPATALGATFPLAVRWVANEARNRARWGGALYALNSAGAATGAMLAGFVLIPAFGVSGTTWVGVAASAVAAGCVAVIARRARASARPVVPPRAVLHSTTGAASNAEALWLAAFALGLSGFAALVHEIAWTRVLTMIFGPTTYAFAATLASVITGIAVGSAAGSIALGRTGSPAFWLAIVLAGAGAAGILSSTLAGGPIPRLVAEQIAQAPNQFDELVWRGGLLTAALILPTSALLGAAFPLALAMIDDPARAAARQFGLVYSLNTIGSVTGSLAAGFVLIPALGLEHTLRVVTLCLTLAAVVVLSWATLRRQLRVRGAIAGGAAIAIMFMSTPWDRELLASGVYLYAPFVPRGLPLEPLLKAGSLLYYREGAIATVSVKRLTGTSTLAVDGKTDASNRGDMLTQKLVAHLPLLLHERPRHVAIIGLGSGVTAGAALTHPIERVDVIELSPEVVAASHIFKEENRDALNDPRTRMLVADGRSHLQLARQQYDVIISEPSNPWIAGVAALFTQEFFTAVRDRLAPGGLVCQWANAYNISDADLRSIVATFRSVFPQGTAWLVGADDVVLIAGERPLDDRLRNIERHWSRAGVAEDLSRVHVTEPFALWSLFVAGSPQLERYAGTAAPLTDDLMTLEFSAPRELGSRRTGSNSAPLRALLQDHDAPDIIRRARATAGAAEWRRRGDMMAGRDAFSDAYGDYRRALLLDPGDAVALSGFARMAVLTRRQEEAVRELQRLNRTAQSDAFVQVALSRLHASQGEFDRAIEAAQGAVITGGATEAALEQLASIHAEAGNRASLAVVVGQMHASMPSHPATHYYRAVAALLDGDATEALRWAEQAVAIDGTYAAAYDLIGAAQVRLREAARARQAFLTSLTFDAHDSTAYANLGVLAMEERNIAAAMDYFAEALWLDPESSLAREGLRRALITGY